METNQQPPRHPENGDEACEVSVAEFYALFAVAVKEDIDAPGMELYDDYDSNKNVP